MTKDKDSDTVEIKLQQVLPEDLHEEILSHAMEMEQEEDQPNGKDVV